MHNSFAQQLLKLRTEQQLSQTDIANLLFVSRQAVSKWENGDAEPSLDNLISPELFIPSKKVVSFHVFQKLTAFDLAYYVLRL